MASEHQEIQEEITGEQEPAEEKETTQEEITGEQEPAEEPIDDPVEDIDILDDSGLGEAVKEREYTSNRTSFSGGQKPKEEKKGIFNRVFAKPEPPKEEDENGVPLFDPSSIEDEQVADAKSKKITTSRFVIDGVEKGLPEILYHVSKISEEDIHKFPKEYHAVLKQASDTLNKNNKEALEVPEWYIDYLREPLSEYFTEKGIEQALPSWIPLLVGVGLLGYWSYSTVTEVKQTNKEHLNYLVTQIHQKNLEQKAKENEFESMREEFKKEMEQMRSKLEEEYKKTGDEKTGDKKS